jgi:hypothetical protein
MLPTHHSTQTKIHVVIVATGSDRVVYSGGTLDVPVKFATEGIYLGTARSEQSSLSLRLLDLRTGNIRVIATSGAWGFISAGAAWGIDAEYGLGGNPNRIDRLDLATGAVTTWYDAPKETWVGVLGRDFDGTLVIGVFSTNRVEQVEDVYRLYGPAHVWHLFAGTASSATVTPWQGFVADSHGLWFTSMGPDIRLWLYSENAGLRVVADSHRLAAAGMSFGGVAGPCR